MKIIRWTAVLVTALFALMNLGAVADSGVETWVRIVAVALAAAGIAAAAGLALDTSWGRLAVIVVGALNVVAGFVALRADQPGGAVGIVVGGLAVVLGVLVTPSARRYRQDLTLPPPSKDLPMNTDDEKSQLLREHWQVHANAEDFEAAHAIYHEDAILEWPQSGERFIGKSTLRRMREHAPKLQFTTWRISGAGDHWTAENFMSVDGGEPQMTASLLQFRGDKVARETVYIAEPFDAAPERAPLATKFRPQDLRA